jgi:hypothetical protein
MKTVCDHVHLLNSNSNGIFLPTDSTFLAGSQCTDLASALLMFMLKFL